MDRADKAEQDLDLVHRHVGPDDERTSEPPTGMDADLERLLIAIHEPAYL